MIRQLKNKFFVTYRRVVTSIAFYPTLISLGLSLLAVLLLILETESITKFLIDHAPMLVINNAETARSILATLIGGIISLTVFSFSMVMVLLNQASSNFSPRLLPGLISDKNNQVVLGIYIGTIIYNIVVLISILPDSDQYTINGFSILIGIALGVFCLAMFVFFIHSISTGIQINFILERIFARTKERLVELTELEHREVGRIDDVDQWHTLYSGKSGYYQGVNVDGLKEYAKDHGAKIKVLPFKGQYLLPNTPVIKMDLKLDDEDREDAKEFLLYGNNKDVADNFVLGIKELTEVGVKAMSPGINDPGTALITIDYLTELLALRMQIDDKEIYQDDDESWTLDVHTVDFNTLIYQVLAAYRQYCKHDIIVMEKIMSMLIYLSKQKNVADIYLEAIDKQITILIEDYTNNIENQSDVDRLNELHENLSN